MTKSFIGLFAAMLLACSASGQIPGEELVGKPAPKFKGALAGGAAFDLGAQLEKGPVLVLFMSTVCPVTNDSAKYYERIAMAYKEAGLAVVGIVNDDEEGFEKWRAVHKTTFPVLLDPEYKVIGDYKVQFAPSVFLINKEGTVAKFWEGYSLGFLEEQSSLSAKALGKPLMKVDFSGAPKQLQAG